MLLKGGNATTWQYFFHIRSPPRLSNDGASRQLPESVDRAVGESGGFCEVRALSEHAGTAADLIEAGLNEGAGRSGAMGIVAAAQPWSGGWSAATGNARCRRAARRDWRLPRIGDGPVYLGGRRRHGVAEAVASGHVARIEAGRLWWKPAANVALAICRARS